jgi:hypothetical protein
MCHSGRLPTSGFALRTDRSNYLQMPLMRHNLTKSAEFQKSSLRDSPSLVISAAGCAAQEPWSGSVSALPPWASPSPAPERILGTLEFH